jgi:hypothetical protein
MALLTEEKTLKEMQAELAELRRRGRELEARVEAHLRAELRLMANHCYQASDSEKLLADVRRFVDERQ